jgi:hypothetical protein
VLSYLFLKNHKRRPKFKPSLRDEEQKEINMSRIKDISIICLLFLTTLVFTSFGSPQTATDNNAKGAQGDNEQAMQALVNEVRQLRLAIQRSNLSAHHSQVVIERMRSQQQTVDRLTERLRWARDEASRFRMYLPLQQAEIQNRLKGIEANLNDALDANTRRAREGELEVTKQRLGMMAQEETRLRENESQLAAQLQIEQAKLGELNDQLDAMQRELEMPPSENKPSQGGKRP